ncbi:MAG: hypothetical protein JO123_05920 [Ktedonobacteraceae bacterium]|nr:hypothetical protein [Ktedonobacteraceae bacterium]
MSHGAIIQLVAAARTEVTATAGTSCGKLPQARWYGLTVLRHPGGQRALLKAAEAKPTT